MLFVLLRRPPPPLSCSYPWCSFCSNAPLCHAHAASLVLILLTPHEQPSPGMFPWSSGAASPIVDVPSSPTTWWPKTWRPLEACSGHAAPRNVPGKQASKTRGPANPFFGLIILLSHNGFAGPRVSSCSSRTWLVLCGPAVMVSAMREGRHWVLSRSCAAFRRLGQ